MIRRKIQKLVWDNILSVRKKDTKQKHDEIKRNQFLTKEELEVLNWEKRRRIVTYAYDKVPYYRKKFDSFGFHPSSLKEPKDYLKVPLLTREDLKENLDEILSLDYSKDSFSLVGTGGTTGEPLLIYKSKIGDGLSSALQTRMLSWWGIQPFSDFASAYRIVKKNESTKKNIKQKSIVKNLKRKVFRLLQYSIKLDPSMMNESSMSLFINILNKRKPEYLVGYVGAIDELANYLIKNKIKTRFSLKAIWVTAAPLSTSQRHKIEKAFNCPVYDQYGSIEVFWLAAECKEKSGLHFFYDTRHIEFLDDSGKPTQANVTGSVVLTDLENYKFPIIRYINGDEGSWKDTNCPCGNNLPLINSIRGRKSDRLFLSDGSSLSGEFLTTIFDDFADEILNFQVIQKRLDYISVNVVIADKKRYIDISKIVKKKLLDVIKTSITIEFNRVDDIKAYKGKLKYIISEV